MGKVPARERRRLFTFWSCDAVEALMQRPDIIRRAFRGTGVGIDIEGKMMTHMTLGRKMGLVIVQTDGFFRAVFFFIIHSFQIILSISEVEW